jgi:hypothetical protein
MLLAALLEGVDQETRTKIKESNDRANTTYGSYSSNVRSENGIKSREEYYADLNDEERK